MAYTVLLGLGPVCSIFLLEFDLRKCGVLLQPEAWYLVLSCILTLYTSVLRILFPFSLVPGAFSAPPRGALTRGLGAGCLL